MHSVADAMYLHLVCTRGSAAPATLMISDAPCLSRFAVPVEDWSETPSLSLHCEMCKLLDTACNPFSVDCHAMSKKRLSFSLMFFFLLVLNWQFFTSLYTSHIFLAHLPGFCPLLGELVPFSPNVFAAHESRRLFGTQSNHLPFRPWKDQMFSALQPTSSMRLVAFLLKISLYLVWLISDIYILSGMIILQYAPEIH